MTEISDKVNGNNNKPIQSRNLATIVVLVFWIAAFCIGLWFEFYGQEKYRIYNFNFVLLQVSCIIGIFTCLWGCFWVAITGQQTRKLLREKVYFILLVSVLGFVTPIAFYNFLMLLCLFIFRVFEYIPFPIDLALGWLLKPYYLFVLLLVINFFLVRKIISGKAKISNFRIFLAWFVLNFTGASIWGAVMLEEFSGFGF